ncbi:hypothetical protein L7F22_052223 [Adiantum nelumboides]|nr:hypothetical protein [Adiantum nelumboides]
MFKIEALLESIRVPVQDAEEFCEQSEDYMGRLVWLQDQSCWYLPFTFLLRYADSSSDSEDANSDESPHVLSTRGKQQLQTPKELSDKVDLNTGVKAAVFIDIDDLTPKKQTPGSAKAVEKDISDLKPVAVTAKTPLKPTTSKSSVLKQSLIESFCQSALQEATAAVDMETTIDPKDEADSLESSTPADFLASCITESSLACRATATSHRRDCQQRERASSPLRSTQRILQDCPGDPYFSGRHLQITAEIRRLLELRISKADRMNRDFFAAHRNRHAGSTMRAIRDTQGVLSTDPDQVLDIASTFYEDLFMAARDTIQILDAREQIWSYTHSRVTEDMCYHLMAPFTVEELHA